MTERALRFRPTGAVLAGLALGLMLPLVAQAQAQPPAAEMPGQAKARACAACHGPQGLSTLVNAPHLAGQPELYLAEQLRAYRSGKRPHEVMSVIAKPLSDNDILDLAAWYASIPIEIKAPR